MNRFNANDNGELVGTSPLFASSWLALFGWLYGYLNQQQRGTDNGKQDQDSPKTH